MQKTIMRLILVMVVLPALAQQETVIIPDKVKIYAIYTPSHRILVDQWFLPSIDNNADFDIVLECHKQECETGKYMQNGWLDTMHHKVDVIIRGIQENQGSFFIHSDVDVQFFDLKKTDLISYMQQYDLVIQKNDPKGVGCAGFFVIRANDKTLRLFQEIKKYMQKTGDHDQNALNYLLKENRLGISWRLLPDEYFGGGTYTGKNWNPGKELKIPKNIKVHHANWTMGVENKIAQLMYVRNHVLGK